ncbi:uncharacterized protein MONBRDRAFT_7353 [Monosiga brevicollis MX1]|uniref:C2H2-type domain-containing protein n=1 Tax=Monosiga brevicollis TaxID=81824 RepID=A9UWQ1_MONBE|nr:uncharacterized protein MONBRDRAFT_7353 [Monosiga brevicollis MX1]EDQ90082.1 predicted protein [Monosiga brevicollis MX1]|eukprot:XP_001744849.1 hypothetical protein [Monosiga brevicollis MX1]
MEEQGFPCAHPGCGKIFTQDCTAEFSRRSDLRIHQRTHAMLHPEEHRCPIASCKKAFLRSSDLKLHMRRHSNDRKYPCDVCHKLFYRPCDVATHMQRCHGPTPATSAHSSTSSASPESVSSCPSNSASIITPKPEPQCTRPVHGAPQDSDQSRSLVQPSNVVRRTGSCCGQSAPSPTATAALGDRSARASAGQYTPPSLCAATSSPDQDAPTSFLPPKDNGLLLLSQAVAHEDPHRWQVCPCGANCRCADCRWCVDQF